MASYLSNRASQASTHIHKMHTAQYKNFILLWVNTKAVFCPLKHIMCTSFCICVLLYSVRFYFVVHQTKSSVHPGFNFPYAELLW